jgi:hypothetical protein
MQLSSQDYGLSMKVSPRARDAGRNSGLRSLLVHRLRSASKAVLRLPLGDNISQARLGAYNVHCEPCEEWFNLPDWGEEVICPRCDRVYALELAVFSEIKHDACDG